MIRLPIINLDRHSIYGKMYCVGQNFDFFWLPRTRVISLTKSTATYFEGAIGGGGGGGDRAEPENCLENWTLSIPEGGRERMELNLFSPSFKEELVKN